MMPVRSWILRRDPGLEGGDRHRDVLTHSLSSSSAVCQLLPSSRTSSAGLPSSFRLSLLRSPS